MSAAAGSPAGPPARSPSPRRRLAAISPDASPEQAAAIVAALERFFRATAPSGGERPQQRPDAWTAAAILEGVERQPPPDLRDPWINP